MLPLVVRVFLATEISVQLHPGYALCLRRARVVAATLLSVVIAAIVAIHVVYNPRLRPHACKISQHVLCAALNPLSQRILLERQHHVLAILPVINVRLGCLPVVTASLARVPPVLLVTLFIVPHHAVDGRHHPVLVVVGFLLHGHADRADLAQAPPAAAAQRRLRLSAPLGRPVHAKAAADRPRHRLFVCEQRVGFGGGEGLGEEGRRGGVAILRLVLFGGVVEVWYRFCGAVG